MNWNNLHEVTAQNEKPAPGWLFQEICQDALHNPQDVPDTAEYLMRCVACDQRTVSMKACLAIRHLADDVPEFRLYMRRCPDALNILRELSEPPQLAQAQSIERPEAKVAREAAARALRSCLAEFSMDKDGQKQQIKQRIQGFGNFAPPEEEQPQHAGARGMIDKVAGFVGDAVADTVDDFREKGAVGAVRDGIADAADLIVDGVGAFWEFLGGRKNKAAAPVEDRICRPIDQAYGGMPPCANGIVGFGAPGFGQAPGVGIGSLGGFPTAGLAPAPPAAAAPLAYQGAFGRGVVGAGHAFHPGLLEGGHPGAAGLAPGAGFASAAVPAPQPAAQAPAPAAPVPPPEPQDLLSFDDEPAAWGGGASSADLLSFDDGVGTPSASAGTGSSASSRALDLKNQGNTLVREKKHAEAVHAYEAALAALEGEEGVESLRAVLFANVALCHLQQQLYRRAVEAATRSLQSDAGHAKAYYRRCLAYKALKMYDEARRDLEALQLCRHEMTDAEMQRLQVALAAGTGPA